MRLRIAIGMMLILLTVGVAIAWGRTGKPVQLISPNQFSQQNSINVVVEQLPAEQGVIPIEIKQAKAVSTAPNQVDELSYIIKNNTSKAITADALTQSIVYEQDGRSYIDRGYETFDSAMHPDISAIHHLKPFAPSSERPITSAGQVSYDSDVVIKEVRVRVEYVEFGDNTTFGAGSEGERRIALLREGAAKYKEWLVQQYRQNGRSVKDILPLLQSHDLPKELGFKQVGQNLGAKHYRYHLLGAYQAQGAAEVEKYLNQ